MLSSSLCLDTTINTTTAWRHYALLPTRSSIRRPPLRRHLPSIPSSAEHYPPSAHHPKPIVHSVRIISRATAHHVRESPTALTGISSRSQSVVEWDISYASITNADYAKRAWEDHATLHTHSIFAMNENARSSRDTAFVLKAMNAPLYTSLRHQNYGGRLAHTTHEDSVR
jgi:hypothetical protein